jgi:hypothetical protein
MIALQEFVNRIIRYIFIIHTTINNPYEQLHRYCFYFHSHYSLLLDQEAMLININSKPTKLSA